VKPGSRFYLLVLIIVFAARLTAQNNSDTIRHDIQITGYIEKMDTIISFRLNVNSEYERFTLSVNNDY
jgi:hypothetical protein